MKKTEYLYGIKPEELEGLEYFTALQYKYDSGVKLYKKLYFTHNRTDDENVRLFHVEKATRHTRKLLDERGEQGEYVYAE